MTREEVRGSMGAPNETVSNVDIWWFKNDLSQLPLGSEFSDSDWAASVEYTLNMTSAMWVSQFEESDGKLDLPCPEMRD